MTTYLELSRPLRLAIAAPWCLLLGVLAGAATPAFRQLLLDPATNQPTAAVSLSGSNWTGTLDPARLPLDPVAGKDVAPASVLAADTVQAGSFFSTSTGGFGAGDFGVYVGGYEIADDTGTLFAADRLVTPSVSIQSANFADGSQLSIQDNRLVWIDAAGSAHVLAFVP